MNASALYDVYARAPVAFARGEGVYLYDEEGHRHLDFGSGVAVVNWGHAHPRLTAALSAQAAKLWHVSNLYRIPGQERVGARLAAASGFADKVFFCNSGAEAVEAAVKTARRCHAAAGRSQRVRIIAFEGAFHGRTPAGLAAAGRPEHLYGFGEPLAGFDRVPLNDIAAVEAAVGDDAAAILIEPIQGEGGVRVADGEFLKSLRRLCDRHGLLLIHDDVQGGMGRCGHLFSHQRIADAAPDIAAVAKGLGGGFPVGACLARGEVAEAMNVGSHGSTFGGAPLAMAVVDAVLDLALEPGFLDDVRRRGLRLKQGLVGLVESRPRLFSGLRGEGMLWGLQCRIPNKTLIDALRRERMLAVAASDNTMRLAPPLIIDEEAMRLGLETLESVCNRLDREGVS